MPLRACASLGCSYAKFDERGFSGNDELGLRCEIRFLARKTSCGLVVVALFLHRQCTKRSLQIKRNYPGDWTVNNKDECRES